MNIKKTYQAINGFELGVKVFATASAMVLATCELAKAILVCKARS